jgi:mRNA interferase YafQ
MPARTPSFSGQFKRDLKLAKRRGKNMGELETLLGLLVDGEPLPERYKDHPLTGDWASHRECHIEPDWLLIYKLLDNGSKVRFERTGTHSDLFR